METFTCGNCSKDFSVTEQAKVHWVLSLGALLISLGMWFPSKLCTGCQSKVSTMGAIGLLLTTAIVIAVLFKLLGQALA
jgi:hypothetical protein